ncbi:hypothetical protein SNS2_0044 [Streptomyces netropsis]|nr:hypothetical protein SNS2_0044 [Streptomyces netropsis]
MDSELAALAAAGATTLVSLMVTIQLLATEAPEDEQAASRVRAEWHARLQPLLEAGSLTSDDLRVLLRSLQRIAATSATRQGTVHNEVNGGVQHGPVMHPIGTALIPRPRSVAPHHIGP